jgi:hypothetical protein
MIEIPQFLSHLPTYRGYPAAFFQLWSDGVPDFRAIDTDKWAQCLKEKLCGICGKRLGEFCYFIGGPLSRDNKLFTDPPMHQDCAEFASRTCPFLSGKKLEYSDKPVEHDNAVILTAPMAPRPDRMFIMRTRTAKIRGVKANGSYLIQVTGPWLGVKEFHTSR